MSWLYSFSPGESFIFLLLFSNSNICVVSVQSCMVQYADGRHTSHYLIDGSDSDGKFHLVDSNASDASEHQSFASVEQLLTAYKIPEYGIAPAPLGESRSAAMVADFSRCALQILIHWKSHIFDIEKQ